MVGSIHPGQSDWVVYLFHGLSGTSDSDYIHRTTRVARELGHTVIRANHRGCGEGAGLARLPYHSGRAEDLSAVIDLGRASFPRHRHLALGFSLSGNALLLLLSGRKGTTLPDAAVSVNAPIHLERAARLLKLGLNRIYDLRFVRECSRDIPLRDPEGARKYRIPWGASLHDFDSIYTAPAAGFRSREHYYESCSTYRVLEEIRVPTLLLTSEDDPFVDVRDYLEAKLSPAIRLHVEKFGGHMGYLTARRTPLGTRRWLDYALREAMSAFAERAGR